MKKQKGITLIALIITIVVLMILAAVAISSIQNDNILSYANNAVKEYEQAQKNEQELLQQYVNYLNNNTDSSNNDDSGSEDATPAIWTQSGTTVTYGELLLNVGDRVKLKIGNEEAVSYTAGDYTGEWAVLGVENEKLLLVTAADVTTLTLTGSDGWTNGETQLENICDAYLNTTYADDARSLNEDDINRITGFDPNNYSGYGQTITFTSNFQHPTYGLASDDNQITVTNYCYYSSDTTAADLLDITSDVGLPSFDIAAYEGVGGYLLWRYVGLSGVSDWMLYNCGYNGSQMRRRGCSNGGCSCCGFYKIRCDSYKISYIMIV